jgi:hypothetical protein
MNDNYTEVDVHMLAEMNAKLDEQKALIKHLGVALIEAWSNVSGTDFTTGAKIRDALCAYRNYLGDDSTPPVLLVGEFNPWNDTISIEGVKYAGALFRDGFSGMIGQTIKIIKRENGVVTVTTIDSDTQRDALRYRYMRSNSGFQHRNGPGLYWYLPRTPELRGLTPDQTLDVIIDANMKGSNYE